MGADFFGSLLLETDAEADADADVREGAAGDGKAGVSFDEAAIATVGARAEPGIVQGTHSQNCFQGIRIVHKVGR